jgi:hypothetical protein
MAMLLLRKLNRKFLLYSTTTVILNIFPQTFFRGLLAAFIKPPYELKNSSGSRLEMMDKATKN